ncbi:MAG: ABC transporter permease [Candidatus Falkowbacteria bacterium]
MFFISLLRVIKFSVQDIIRNFWLSFVTIIILVLSLSLINIVLIVQLVTQSAITSVKDKIDIVVDINNTAEEAQILELRDQIAKLERVRRVDYITKAKALEDFRKKYENQPNVLQALRVINKNPIGASLLIKAKDINQFDSLITDLNKITNPIIEKRDVDDPRDMLGKINVIADKINKVGYAISIIFIIITVLVVYNSIRVAIYTHKREIKIMRLVGASNWFIQSPFLLSSVIYTLLGIGITLGLFYPFVNLLQPYLEYFINDYQINLVSYLHANFWRIFGTEFLIAALVNLLASWVAVRKYSRN